MPAEIQELQKNCHCNVFSCKSPRYKDNFFAVCISYVGQNINFNLVLFFYAAHYKRLKGCFCLWKLSDPAYNTCFMFTVQWVIFSAWGGWIFKTVLYFVASELNISSLEKYFLTYCVLRISRGNADVQKCQNFEYNGINFLKDINRNESSKLIR